MYVKTRKILQSNWVDTIPDRPQRLPTFQLGLVRFFFRTIGWLFPKWSSKIAYKLFATPTVRAKHGKSDSILESARIFDVLYGRQILKGYAWGPREDAPTVLLVHGWNSRGTALRSFVPDLVERGYRVVAMDGPAHGHSDGKQTNLINFAGGVRAMINHLGDLAGIITHSFGGASTLYALGHLDLNHRVEKLVLVGVPAKIDRVIAHSERTLGLPKNVSRHFRTKLERMVGNTLEELDSASFKNEARVDSILIVHDREDAVVKFRSAEENYRELERASLLITEGYGHFRMMKNPDVVSAVVEFINGVQAPSKVTDLGVL